VSARLLVLASGMYNTQACSYKVYIYIYIYISSTGRTVLTYDSMGWWPTKLCVILAVVVSLGFPLVCDLSALTHEMLQVILGYGLVDAVTTGLVFSAVSGGSMSTIVGIVRPDNL
jgi:hypothetical protein